MIRYMLVVVLAFGFMTPRTMGATTIEYGLIAAQLLALGIVCPPAETICGLCETGDVCDITPSTTGCFSGISCVVSVGNQICTSDSDCTDPATPNCDLNVCVADPNVCISDADCADPALPFCDIQTMLCTDVAPIDTDQDGMPDAVDLDDDNDGVLDVDDADPINNSICEDADNDTCDDCSMAMGNDPSNDGPDSDGDGICDAGDMTCDCDDPQAIAPAFEFRGKTYFFGTFGDDIICGTPERDVIFSFAGDDCIDSGDGNDRVFAGFGDDVIHLGAGNDRALAGPGNDDVEGGMDEDRVHGGFGEDYCDAEITSGCEVSP
ncbi:MAG: calcium-binding protein [Thermodesulfobacteriota bacterium]